MYLGISNQIWSRLMTRLISLVFFIILSLSGHSQFECANAFVSDTMSIPESDKVLEGSYVEVTLKDFSVVRLFKTNQETYYLRLLVKKNFYFNKTEVLEINSGSKSIRFKERTQYKVDKTTGLFIQEVPRNYIFTLTHDGITSITFANAETKFTKSDANLIKKMAKCFYEDITTKK